MNPLNRTYARLRKSLLKRYYAGRRNSYTVKRLHDPGVFFLINFHEKTDRLALLNRNEAEQLHKILAWARQRPATLVLDIGANFGLYGVTLAHRLPAARIVAFEPNDAARTRLAANVLINDLANVEVLPYAASSADGTTRFINNIVGHSGISRVKDDELLARMKKHSFKFRDSNWEETTVQTRRLDALVPEHGRDIAIKIDTEGHECEVLKGMERLLRDNNCYVQVEISEKLAEHRDEVAIMMAHAGYVLRERIGPDHIYVRDALCSRCSLPGSHPGSP